MSDTIQERLRRFAAGDSADNHTDPMEHVCTEAADEIDRLRAELAEARERVAELECAAASRDITEDCEEDQRSIGAYNITDDQINAAWSRLQENEEWGGYEHGVFDALNDLGIVACPRCDGTKRIYGFWWWYTPRS